MIEMSIVILIVAILTLPLLSMYQNYLIGKQMEETQDRIENAAAGMIMFSPSTFPCPADRSLGPNNANYGFANCIAMTGANKCATGTEGICWIEGARDTDFDGNLVVENIIIGGVPFRAGIPGAESPIPGMDGGDTLDAWGNKLTYAISVTLTATIDGINNYKYGVIRGLDENGNPTAGINDDAQFVIVSHGKTGRGAFTRNGVMMLPCDVDANSDDFENCDNDSTFVQALGNYEAAGGQFFDDFLHFYREPGGDLWSRINNGATATDHIQNLNSGNVGVNNAAPAVKLDVTGTINADTVKARNFCNKNGANCITFTAASAKLLNTETCATTGAVMTGIDSQNAECAKPTITPFAGYTGAVCTGAGNYIKGVLTNGCVICTSGATSCCPDGTMACVP